MGPDDFYHRGYSGSCAAGYLPFHLQIDRHGYSRPRSSRNRRRQPGRVPEVTGRAETNLLAATFNGMLDRLKDYLSRLQLSNSRLTAQKPRTRPCPPPTADFLYHCPGNLCADFPEGSRRLLDRQFNIVECRHMALIVFISESEEALITGDRGPFPRQAAGAYLTVVADMTRSVFE